MVIKQRMLIIAGISPIAYMLRCLIWPSSGHLLETMGAAVTCWVFIIYTRVHSRISFGKKNMLIYFLLSVAPIFVVMITKKTKLTDLAVLLNWQHLYMLLLAYFMFGLFLGYAVTHWFLPAQNDEMDIDDT